MDFKACSGMERPLATCDTSAHALSLRKMGGKSVDSSVFGGRVCLRRGIAEYPHFSGKRSIRRNASDDRALRRAVRTGFGGHTGKGGCFENCRRWSAAGHGRTERCLCNGLRARRHRPVDGDSKSLQKTACPGTHRIGACKRDWLSIAAAGNCTVEDF